jgi:hypothetical protein
MRVTIDIDEKSGSTAITPNAASSSASSPAADTAPSSSPPPEVMAIATATGAFNGGPAPNTSSDAAPHPFHSHAAVSETTHAAAESGGTAKT